MTEFIKDYSKEVNYPSHLDVSIRKGKEPLHTPTEWHLNSAEETRKKSKLNHKLSSQSKKSPNSSLHQRLRDTLLVQMHKAPAQEQAHYKMALAHLDTNQGFSKPSSSDPIEDLLNDIPALKALFSLDLGQINQVLKSRLPDYKAVISNEVFHDKTLAALIKKDGGLDQFSAALVEYEKSQADSTYTYNDPKVALADVKSALENGALSSLFQANVNNLKYFITPNSGAHYLQYKSMIESLHSDPHMQAYLKNHTEQSLILALVEKELGQKGPTPPSKLPTAEQMLADSADLKALLGVGADTGMESILKTYVKIMNAQTDPKMKEAFKNYILTLESNYENSDDKTKNPFKESISTALDALLKTPKYAQFKGDKTQLLKELMTKINKDIGFGPPTPSHNIPDEANKVFNDPAFASTKASIEALAKQMKGENTQIVTLMQQYKKSPTKALYDQIVALESKMDSQRSKIHTQLVSFITKNAESLGIPVSDISSVANYIMGNQEKQNIPVTPAKPTPPPTHDIAKEAEKVWNSPDFQKTKESVVLIASQMREKATAIEELEQKYKKNPTKALYDQISNLITQMNTFNQSINGKLTDYITKNASSLGIPKADIAQVAKYMHDNAKEVNVPAIPPMPTPPPSSNIAKEAAKVWNSPDFAQIKKAISLEVFKMKGLNTSILAMEKQYEKTPTKALYDQIYKSISEMNTLNTDINTQLTSFITKNASSLGIPKADIAQVTKYIHDSTTEADVPAVPTPPAPPTPPTPTGDGFDSFMKDLFSKFPELEKVYTGNTTSIRGLVTKFTSLAEAESQKETQEWKSYYAKNPMPDLEDLRVERQKVQEMHDAFLNTPEVKGIMSDFKTQSQQVLDAVSKDPKIQALITKAGYTTAQVDDFLTHNIEGATNSNLLTTADQQATLISPFDGALHNDKFWALDKIYWSLAWHDGTHPAKDPFLASIAGDFSSQFGGPVTVYNQAKEALLAKQSQEWKQLYVQNNYHPTTAQKNALKAKMETEYAAFEKSAKDKMINGQGGYQGLMNILNKYRQDPQHGFLALNNDAQLQAKLRAAGLTETDFNHYLVMQATRDQRVFGAIDDPTKCYEATPAYMPDNWLNPANSYKDQPNLTGIRLQAQNIRDQLRNPNLSPADKIKLENEYANLVHEGFYPPVTTDNPGDYLPAADRSKYSNWDPKDAFWVGADGKPLTKYPTNSWMQYLGEAGKQPFWQNNPTATWPYYVKYNHNGITISSPDKFSTNAGNYSADQRSGMISMGSQEQMDKAQATPKGTLAAETTLTGGGGSQKILFVQGSPYNTIDYNNLTPQFNLFPQGSDENDGHVSSIEVTLADGSTKTFAPPTAGLTLPAGSTIRIEIQSPVSPGSSTMKTRVVKLYAAKDHPISLKFDGKGTLTATGKYSGILREASLPENPNYEPSDESAYEKTLDQYSDVVITGGDFTTDGDYYHFAFTKEDLDGKQTAKDPLYLLKATAQAHLCKGAKQESLTYQTVQGPLRAVAGTILDFKETSKSKTGKFIPDDAPKLSVAQAQADIPKLEQALQAEMRRKLNLGDMYGSAKILSNQAQLLDYLKKAITDANPNLSKEQVLAKVKEFQVDGQSAVTKLGQETSWMLANGFTWDQGHHGILEKGSDAGSAAEYGNGCYNDLHFHYGYLIQAASVAEELDPSWASQQNSGTTNKTRVNDLVATIMEGSNDDKNLAKMRMFDPYNSHSNAGGIFQFGNGRNQESTSEAVNAWLACQHWGEVTKQDNITDQAAMLASMESDGAKTYWQIGNPDNSIYSGTEFSKYLSAGIIWDNSAAHATWFAADPGYINGIQELPSFLNIMELKNDPAYARRLADHYEQIWDTNVPVDPWAKCSLLGLIQTVDPKWAAAKIEQMKQSDPTTATILEMNNQLIENKQQEGKSKQDAILNNQNFGCPV